MLAREVLLSEVPFRSLTPGKRPSISFPPRPRRTPKKEEEQEAKIEDAAPPVYPDEPMVAPDQSAGVEPSQLVDAPSGFEGTAGAAYSTGWEGDQGATADQQW